MRVTTKNITYGFNNEKLFIWNCFALAPFYSFVWYTAGSTNNNEHRYGVGAEGVYVNTIEGLSAEGCVNNVARMPRDHVW